MNDWKINVNLKRQLNTKLEQKWLSFSVPTAFEKKNGS
jgi:hypothetical protein